MPARKVRVIAKAVNRKKVEEALNMLRFIDRNAAPHMTKVLKSAVANASKNFGADADTLVIKSIVVDHGPTLKYARRFMPRAMGRATRIDKKTSHVYVELGIAERA